jgi:hypothetical protein
MKSKKKSRPGEMNIKKPGLELTKRHNNEIMRLKILVYF